MLKAILVCRQKERRARRQGESNENHGTNTHYKGQLLSWEKLKKQMAKPILEQGASMQAKSVNRERKSGEGTTEGSWMIDRKVSWGCEVESGRTKQLRK
jgi:hypothetical protein